MFEKFCGRLSGRDSFITVEITPPHGSSISTVIEKIEAIGLHKKVNGFCGVRIPL